MKRRKREWRSRKPTYGAAVRIARLILSLGSRPFGWSLRDLRGCA